MSWLIEFDKKRILEIKEKLKDKNLTNDERNRLEDELYNTTIELQEKEDYELLDELGIKY